MSTRTTYFFTTPVYGPYAYLAPSAWGLSSMSNMVSSAPGTTYDGTLASTATVTSADAYVSKLHLFKLKDINQNFALPVGARFTIKDFSVTATGAANWTVGVGIVQDNGSGYAFVGGLRELTYTADRSTADLQVTAGFEWGPGASWSGIAPGDAFRRDDQYACFYLARLNTNTHDFSVGGLMMEMEYFAPESTTIAGTLGMLGCGV